MNTRTFDWIWRITGAVTLPAHQSNEDAFRKLAPLFEESGTSHERSDDTLTFTKKDPVAQDKMSIFNHGVLQIRNSAAGSVLHYRLTSKALLLCFLAPLLFLAFAGLTIAAGKLEKTFAEEPTKKPEKKSAEPKLHPIDTFLGAPAPEKPKPDGDAKAADDKKQPTPKAAYIFAAIFAALYVVGRVLEDRLVRSLFRKQLHLPPEASLRQRANQAFAAVMRKQVS